MCSALALHRSSEANCPHPTLRASKAQLGLSVLLLPSHAGWEHLLCHMGFDELPKWGKRQPREKQGHRARGADPVLLSPISPGEVLSLVGKGFKGSLLLC